MIRKRSIIVAIGGLALISASVALAWGPSGTLPGQASDRRDQDESLLDTSFGFPLTIAFSHSNAAGRDYRWRTLFLLIEDRYCSSQNLRAVFQGLAERCQEANFIEIDVYSDPEMLRRAIGRFKQYPDELQFTDTPEGEEFEKTIRGDLFIPKTGWARARYYKNPKDGEKFYYKPDPEKVEMLEVVIKAPPVPTYVGEPQHDLFLACKLGDVPKAKALIQNGAKVDYNDEHGEAPLIYAVGHNRPEIVELLLAHGADVNAKDKFGQTALCAALSYRFHEIVFMLLDHNADVNARYGRGITPLLQASYQGDEETAEALLSRGADPNAQNEDGKTPLFNAIRSRKVTIVQALLNRGALTTVKDNRGQTPEDLAKEAGDQAILKLLRRN